MVGLRFGRHRYRVGEGWRSLEGSLAMLLFSAAAVACVGFWVSDSPYSLWLIGVAALVATLLEAGSRRGLDNLLVPLGTALILWGLG